MSVAELRLGCLHGVWGFNAGGWTSLWTTTAWGVEGIVLSIFHKIYAAVGWRAILLICSEIILTWDFTLVLDQLSVQSSTLDWLACGQPRGVPGRDNIHIMLVCLGLRLWNVVKYSGNGNASRE